MPRLSVHIYPSPITSETRILKMTRAMLDCGVVDRVIVVGIGRGGLAPREAIDGQRDIWRISQPSPRSGFVAKLLRTMQWAARVFTSLARESITVVNCHSLSALPVCAAVAAWHRAVLIYEPHELETETATFAGTRGTMAKWLEGWLVKRAAGVIVVSDSIAEEYRRAYGLQNVVVLRNVPALEPVAGLADTRLLRDRFQIADGELLFMYQGLLDERRGVRWVLDAFKGTAPDRHIVLMGFGPLETEVRAAAAAAGNIHFLPAVPPAEVLRYTCSADVGLALLADDCLNHQYALPNKFFQYLHCGVPVIASDLKEMAAIVDRYACGWRVGSGMKAIESCIAGIDRAAVDARRAGATQARADLHWDNEVGRLESFYRNLFPTARAGSRAES